jgi:uracil phosphoribosyltransferase
MWSIPLFGGLAECQGGIAYARENVTTLNDRPVIKHLLSMLRDKATSTADYRRYSDRIMRLLVEEAIAGEIVDVPERKLSPTGEMYDHYGLKAQPSEYCAVTIIRAGDSMVQETFNLLPGIAIGKVLI